ncbi:MAG: C_GCAxxG_C_C family protein [Gammaproteobacteria bacterium (ex Lamellibrachia satsuma)]|nr:MAG: C_GCAxxG_C_C family protein [Gammaproteobacteria bacterium (ex Lamellibrachia satsuma)]
MNEDHKSNQRILRSGERAEHYFAEGYCCSEAILLAMADIYPNSAKTEVAGLASGLCGGMGNKKATCGVFTGGAAAFGLVAGKAPQKGGNRQIKELASRYHEILEQEAGGQICEEILKQMGIGNLNKRQCKKLTRRGSELLAQLIEQSKLAT